MGRKRYPPDDPREWLNRARSNLEIAKNETVGAYLEDLAFEAQQAVEKAVKAVFICRGVNFPYIHDIAELLQRLEQSGVKVPKYVRQATELTPFAVEGRYPGLIGPLTLRKYRRKVRIAEIVLRWAEHQIEKP